MSKRCEVDWYFDFISPFAYLQARSFHELPENITIRPIPVLFAGLLNHFGQKGPAEIEGKREHTYRYCTWYATRHNIRFRMPDAHPFNPLGLLRLAILKESSVDEIVILFRGIFEKGFLPLTPEYNEWISAKLNWDADLDLLPECPVEVKNQLRVNTENAIENDVFGVPTFRYVGMNFWGVDATGMLKDALTHPGYFDSDEYRRLASLSIAQSRK